MHASLAQAAGVVLAQLHELGLMFLHVTLLGQLQLVEAVQPAAGPFLTVMLIKVMTIRRLMVMTPRITPSPHQAAPDQLMAAWRAGAETAKTMEQLPLAERMLTGKMKVEVSSTQM
jgi:hypothetical protein